MKKLTTLALLIVISAPKSQAQVVDGNFGLFQEVELFSQTSPGFSARLTGIGGAVTALGGDPSSIATNPAGLGFYNRSEVSITPGLNFYSSSTDYFGNVANENVGTNLTIPNFSVVFNFTKDDLEIGKFRGGSLGFSASTINNLDQEFFLNQDMAFVENTLGQGSSILDFFVDQAGVQDPGNLAGLTELAFNQFLISPLFNEDGQIDRYGFIQDGFPIQTDMVSRRGSQNQFSFSFGGNYDDKLYFGVGLNVQTLDYTQETFLIESDYSVADPILTELSTSEFIEVSGTGVSGTFGLIYRPIDLIRFGASVTTPMSLNIDRESGFDLQSIYDGSTIIDPIDSMEVTLTEFLDLSPIFISEYEFNMPLRFNLGTAIFFSKNGFISFEAEYLDLSGATIDSNDFPVDAENQTINNVYEPTWNFRFGGEYRWNKLRFRAGYALQQNPNELLSEIDSDISTFSGGIGLRLRKFFIDAAYTNRQWESAYSPYSFSTLDIATPVATIDNKIEQVLLTLGLTF